MRPGELAAFLPRDIGCFGVDARPHDLARARERFGDRAEFKTGDATKLSAAGQRFEVVLILGVLHHLDNGAADGLVSVARTVMAGGRLVTVDPAYTPRRSLVVRAIIGRDRGQHVREAECYGRLAATAFQSSVHTTVRDDLLRIPYAHCIPERAVPFGKPAP